MNMNTIHLPTAQSSLSVLKVLLNTNQPIKQPLWTLGVRLFLQIG